MTIGDQSPMKESGQDIRIKFLSDVPTVIPLLTKWFIDEWTPWYGPGGQGNAAADLNASCNRNRLPLAIVAIDQTDEVLGTATLKDDSLGRETAPGPWLAALLVAKEHRGKGVGTALVAAIEEHALRLGFEAIYTSTNTAKSILERRGWKSVATAESLRGPVSVMRRELSR